MSYAHLSDAFFTEQFPTADFLQKQRGLEAWSLRIVPVSQWQDLIFVAFADELPPALKAKNYVFVRASEKQIAKVYEQISKDYYATDVMSLINEASNEGPDHTLQQKEAPPRSAQHEEETLELQLSPLNTKPVDLSALSTLIKKDTEPTTKDKPQNSKNSPEEKPLNEWAQQALEEMKVHYQKAMILIVQDHTAVPSHWDKDFVHQESSNNFIPLNSASPFRIVYRTQKSYHGFITPNDLNEKFFEQWNQGVTPDHMTLTPIVVDDEVVGLLLGIGEKSSDNKMSLHFCEKLAVSLAEHFRAAEVAA